MGVAAIIAAIAPMVVANIQAKADVKIAEINAETQKTLTTITSNTSKYLADGQKEIALTQSAIAQQISQQNNAGVTDRLKMQLDELRSARQDAQQAEKERRDIDNAYNQQRIELAQKQASDNLSLAKATLNAQLSQAGLSQGFSNSTNSGDRLGVSRAGVAAGGGTSVASAAGSGSAGSQLSAGGGGTGLGIGAPSSSARSTSMAASSESVPTGGSLGLSPRAQRGFAPEDKVASDPSQKNGAGDPSQRNGASQLLRSVNVSDKGSAPEEEDEWQIDPVTKKHVRVPKKLAQAGAPARGVRSRGVVSYGNVVTVGRGATQPRRFSDELTSVLMNTLASGSTAAAHRAGAGGKSDFGSFLGSGVASRGPDFVRYREQGKAAAAPEDPSPRAIRTATAHAADKPGSQAYNQPEIESGGHSGTFTFPEGFSIPGLTLPGSQ